MESSTAQNSNIGKKNQERKGEGSSDAGDLNDANRESGNGGTRYSEFLNSAQNNFISGTGEFDKSSNSEDNNTTRPFDAMQGNTSEGSDEGQRR